MKLMKFMIRHIHAGIWKTVDLNANVCIFHSMNNSTGKTTLMRAILYTMGFSVPGTELVKFADYEYRLEIIVKGNSFDLIRKNNLLVVNEMEFDLPVEQASAHTFLFGIANPELLYNLLGTIYFDQEKGWTLLNRGKIIGSNRFSVEVFFRGLKNDESEESYELFEQIKELERKIAQYHLLSNVAEYQNTINQLGGSAIDYQTFDQELMSEICELQIQLNEVESELIRLDEVIKANKSFSDYIESRKIYVRNPYDDDSPIPVNRNTLLDYRDVANINLARQSKLISERNKLKKRLAQLTSQQEKEVRLLNTETLDEEITKKLANIKDISSIEVDSLLKKLKVEKKKLSDILNNRTKRDNPWITQAYEIIMKYAEELRLPFDYKIDIFTHNLKEKTGAILHKMIFAYKLAFIKLLSTRIGYPLPIFCDSPSGREVEKDTIALMLEILRRDFGQHQLIVASINKYEEVFPNANIIEMDGTLFNLEQLFDQ